LATVRRAMLMPFSLQLGDDFLVAQGWGLVLEHDEVVDHFLHAGVETEAPLSAW